MQASSKFEVPINDPSEDFIAFFEIPSNARILFSGMFGSGKTTFLRKFFHQHVDDYLTIHLFPTNYVANRNEDVFELIKFDIIYELLKNGATIESRDISLPGAVALLLREDPIKILQPIIECIPKIGKDITSIVNALSDLRSKILAKAKNASKNEGTAIKELVEEFVATKGHVYENDLYTDLIKSLLKCTAGDRRKCVLIVDDIDRIDPENIFRLLNVFSVHLDVAMEGDNKFNFDRIVFVCDVDNVRDIFHAKFGQNANFSGYIDKFYSTNVYNFDNRSAIQSAVNGILKSIKPSKQHAWANNGDRQNSVIFSCLDYIVSCMIQSRTFSLRQLVKLRDYNFKELVEYADGNLGEVYILPLLELLITIFGDRISLLQALRRTRCTFFSGNTPMLLVSNCLIVFNDFDRSAQTAHLEFDSKKLTISLVWITVGHQNKMYAAVPLGTPYDRSISTGVVLQRAVEHYAAHRIV